MPFDSEKRRAYYREYMRLRRIAQKTGLPMPPGTVAAAGNFASTKRSRPVKEAPNRYHDRSRTKNKSGHGRRLHIESGRTTADGAPISFCGILPRGDCWSSEGRSDREICGTCDWVAGRGVDVAAEVDADRRRRRLMRHRKHEDAPIGPLVKRDQYTLSLAKKAAAALLEAREIDPRRSGRLGRCSAILVGGPEDGVRISVMLARTLGEARSKFAGAPTVVRSLYSGEMGLAVDVVSDDDGGKLAYSIPPTSVSRVGDDEIERTYWRRRLDDERGNDVVSTVGGPRRRYYLSGEGVEGRSKIADEAKRLRK